jgi:hypothetical protein
MAAHALAAQQVEAAAGVAVSTGIARGIDRTLITYEL